MVALPKTVHRGFWARVERAMSDFAKWKQCLAEHAGGVVGL